MTKRLLLLLVRFFIFFLLIITFVVVFEKKKGSSSCYLALALFFTTLKKHEKGTQLHWRKKVVSSWLRRFWRPFLFWSGLFGSYHLLWHSLRISTMFFHFISKYFKSLYNLEEFSNTLSRYFITLRFTFITLGILLHSSKMKIKYLAIDKMILYIHKLRM